MDPESSPRHEHKRSYSMEHFRWGKPVGRKRRPIKVYTNGVEEESAETLPAEMRRELATNEVDYPLEEGALNQQEKKDGSYKMSHFRWSAPPASKRYGGFMKSWDERSQKPLLTLFKNVINKEHQKDKWGVLMGGVGRGLFLILFNSILPSKRIMHSQQMVGGVTSST